MAVATRTRKSPRRQRLEAAINYPIDWLEERSGLIGGIRYFLFRKVPGDTNWMQTLGSATLTAFIVLLFFHMARVFLFGAYKYPRELNWIVGVLLLLLGMLEGFTGYLLPWDQTAYWATVVGINLNGTVPVLGPFIAQFLRGGAEIGQNTLSIFYSTHMLLIPGAIFALIGLHLYLVVRLGVSSPPWSKEAAGADWIEEAPSTDGHRAGLTRPAARSAWRRNGGDSP